VGPSSPLGTSINGRPGPPTTAQPSRRRVGEREDDVPARRSPVGAVLPASPLNAPPGTYLPPANDAARFARVRSAHTTTPPAPYAAAWANVGGCAASVGHRSGTRSRPIRSHPAPPGTRSTPDLGRAVSSPDLPFIHLARHHEVGKEGDGAAKLPKARTRGTKCLVVRVWGWSGCARLPVRGRLPLVPRPPLTVPTVGAGRAR